MTRSLGCQLGGRLCTPTRRKTPATRTELNRQRSVHRGGQKLNSRPHGPVASGVVKTKKPGDCLRPERGSSEDGAEELLLPEGVLRGRQRHDERVLAYVRVAERHQVCGGFGDLQGRDERRVVLASSYQLTLYLV